MTNCYRCGQAIEFRVVDGQAIPFHLDGSCSANSTSWATYGDFAGGQGIREHPAITRPSHGTDDLCYPTTCPKCGDTIAFVRHNGGCVWLDQPLGWPWPKHRCMYEDEHPGDFAPVFNAPSGLLRIEDEARGIGVIGNVAVFRERRFSILQMHLANGKLRLIGIEGLHSDLCEEVAILYSHFKRLHLITVEGLRLYVPAEHTVNPFGTESE